MQTGAVYSLKQERLQVERQQSVVRLLLATITSLVLLKVYYDQGEVILSAKRLITMLVLLNGYSLAIWVIHRFLPNKHRPVFAVGSIIELLIISYLVKASYGTSVPFYLWYIFYVINIATSYGRQYSILALAGCLISFTTILLMTTQGYKGYTTNVPAVLGFTLFLLVLSYLFGQISERQLNYQASLAVVNEMRGELATLATPRDILAHVLDRTKELINVEHTFFLPARRGADASEAPGIRSAGADPVLLSTFREGGGVWNVEDILKEQKPIFSNNLAKDNHLPEKVISKLGLRNLAAAPMILRNVEVGVLYAANRKDQPLSQADIQMLELIAVQAAPVVENAVLWERLRESAASEERVRIARDLHDNVLQTLAAIKMHLERSKILMQKDSNRALESIDRIHEIATRGLAETRAYLSELRMMGPEPTRFKQAVEKAVMDAASRAGFEANLEVRPPDEAMAPNLALAAFQILRELLNNVVNHSKAEHVQVRIGTEGGKLVIEIEDDGQGFDVAKVRAEKSAAGHMGLVGIEERTKQANGSFVVTSEPGKGTRATANLAL